MSAEIENQVETHLQNHLNKLPTQDDKRRAIIEMMKKDERRHGDAARNLGEVDLTMPVQKGMQTIIKVMTTGAYWI